MPQFQLLPEQPSFESLLGEKLGTGVATGIQNRLNQFHKQQELQRTENIFEKQGYPKDLAKLAAAATTGGKTEVLKQLLEMRQRSPSESETIEEEVIEKPDEGLTPSEKIKREEGRFTKQSDKYSEISEKSLKLDQEHSRLQRLQELNEKGNLPEGLGRLNVNIKSGELIAPFFASPDSQEFIKIVNDFLSGAKDTFGARVTNFEVNRFLRRLPSLLNTAEGRRRVLRQMEIINEINQLHNQGILDEFDQKGGIRKIDFDQAIRNSTRKNKEKIKELHKEYISGEKEKNGNELTEDIAIEILKESKGDKEKARKIAKKRGYSL